MSEKTGSKDIQVVIDDDSIIILGEVRHSNRIRAEVVNQSLDILDDTFLMDYSWRISHVDLFNSQNGKWTINATADGNYELGDFDPEEIESLTHFVEEETLILRLNADVDEIMEQTHQRALEQTREEIASQTRYDSDHMDVTHTSVVDQKDEDTTRQMKTRIRMDY